MKQARVIAFRLHAEDWKLLEQRAADLHYVSASALIRQYCRFMLSLLIPTGSSEEELEARLLELDHRLRRIEVGRSPR